MVISRMRLCCSIKCKHKGCILIRASSLPSLVSRLGEQGKWDVIEKTFEHLRNGGHLIYAVLVDIYGQYGKFEDAEECINALKPEGVPLSARVFCVLANAYAQRRR
ncbi:putative tetratricopeptide-like helical domain superfamily [Helianthus annuus]|nr:putative tetratricopeptide-like helical domain superfamily [Helianthus annuus]